MTDRPGRARHRMRPQWRSVSLIVLAVALLWAPASIAATPADRAATYAFLQASYRLDDTILQNAPASRSSATALTEHLAQECHEVLSGAPRGGLESSLLSGGPATPRARGERQRSKRQLQTIQEELELSFIAAIYRPDRAAAEAFLHR
jgi:hypothetical protein